MTDKLPGLNPLMTFELEADEWQEILDAVKREGTLAWDEWVPTIIAALELGYLDNHLQMIGKWARGRYMHLKDSNNLPALYAEAAGKKGRGAVVGRAAVSSSLPASDGSSPNGTWADYDTAIQTVTARGALIVRPGLKPVRKFMPGETLKGEFETRGWVYDKMHFVGMYFTSPVPLRPEALYRIDKVNRENLAVTCVARKGHSMSGVGSARTFRIDQNFALFDIPSA